LRNRIVDREIRQMTGVIIDVYTAIRLFPICIDNFLGNQFAFRYGQVRKMAAVLWSSVNIYAHDEILFEEGEGRPFVTAAILKGCDFQAASPQCTELTQSRSRKRRLAPILPQDAGSIRQNNRISVAKRYI
jgi:hypothetical protein